MLYIPSFTTSGSLLQRCLYSGQCLILEGAIEGRGPDCHLQESSCGLQAYRLILLPGHCGHLSNTGHMPTSKIFAPQNTEAEIYDILLIPSFCRVDKKICWLLCGIICKGNVICLHFINPVIMLAMKLPTWLLHVFSDKFHSILLDLSVTLP